MNKFLFLFVSLFFSMSAQTQVMSADCEGTKGFLELSGLSCIHCGINEATGLYASDKWLAFLGAGVTRNFSDANYTSTGPEREAFYRRVIEAVQAYGFCMASELDADGRPTNQTGLGNFSHSVNVKSGWLSSKNVDPKALITPLVSGSLIKRRNTDNYKDDQELARKIFGFENQKFIDELFPAQSWDNMSILQRRNVIQKTLDYPLGVLDGSTSFGKAMAKCMNQLSTLQKNYSFFAVNGKYQKDNQKMCATLARTCGIADGFCKGPAPVAQGRTADLPMPWQMGGPAPAAPQAPSLFNKGGQ